MLRWWHHQYRHQQNHQRTMENNVVTAISCLLLLCIHYVFAFNHLQPQHFHRRQFYHNDDSENRQVGRQQMSPEKDLPLFHSWLATNESRIFYIRSGALGNEWITTDKSIVADNDLLQPDDDDNADEEVEEEDDDDEVDDVTGLYHFHPKNNNKHIPHNHHNINRDDTSKRQNKHRINYNKINDLNVIKDTNLTRSNVRHIASRYRRQHTKQISNKRYGKKRKKRLRSVPDLSFINKHHHHPTIHWPVKKEAVIEGKSIC